MKLLGAVLGFELGNENDLDSKMETDIPPQKKETNTSKPTTTTKTTTNEQKKNTTSEQNPAEIEKEKGNEAYKKKDFETALKHYNKAIELDPINMTYYTNRAGSFTNFFFLIQLNF